MSTQKIQFARINIKKILKNALAQWDIEIIRTNLLMTIS